MSAVVSLRLVSKLALTGLAGVWLAGCSTDSSRLAEGFSNPFSNPFSSSTAAADAAPTPAVAVKPLAQNEAPAGPVVASALPAPVAANPVRIAGTPGAAKGWSAAGGSPIVVAEGDNLDGVSRRYGVPGPALLSANGFSSAAQVHGGVRLIIPVFSASAGAPKAEAVADATPSLKKKAKAKVGAELADANVDAPAKKAKAKKKIVDDALKTVDAVKAAPTVAAKAAPALVAKAAPATKSDAPAEVAIAAKKKLPGEVDKATTTASLGADTAAKAAPTTAAQADASGTTPEFRWPARGRIIEGFKVGANDGINISVPEGTSVRAAESGVVAYSGDGLKGYGNLVLIRHPNGYVTAYANNAALNVKSGDTVKRGQIIATSGQTGNVNAPQLHFELRKGKTPIDPTSYLAGL